jgi:hypothetical protein
MEPDALHKLLADRFREYATQLTLESDRGAVIVGAALVEEGLKGAIVARLVPSTSKEDELLDGRYAPCSSFASRIELVHRIGVIGTSLRAGLHIIRKLRNDAAHIGSPIDFETPAFKDRARSLYALHHKLIETVWQDLIVDNEPLKAHLSGELPDSPDSLANLVQTLGWRRVWDVFLGMVAAVVSLAAMEQERLTMPPPIEAD